MNALFSMPGGKNYQKKIIVPQFPKHKIYIEPFVGAGSIFFSKEKSEVEIINDGDSEISAFYSYLKAHNAPPQFPKEMITRDRFEYYRELIPKDEHARFVKQFIVQQFSFRGNRRSYSPARGEGMRAADTKFYKNYSRYHERLQGVTILNCDYKEVINQHACNNSFTYLDPPYETGTKSDVSNASDEGDWYGKIDIDELVCMLTDCPGLWMLSFSDNKELAEKLKHFKIKKYQTIKMSTTSALA